MAGPSDWAFAEVQVQQSGSPSMSQNTGWVLNMDSFIPKLLGWFVSV